MTPRLALAGITKHYGDVAANEDVTLAVMPGEILALLGETLSQRLQTFHGLLLVRLARTKVIQIVISGWAGAHASLRRRREGRAS